MKKRVAVMIDGSTTDPAHAKLLMREAGDAGEIVLARVYVNAPADPKWRRAGRIHAVDSGTEQTSAVLLMSLDAVEFALTDVFDAILLATSDGAFAPLMQRLRGYGMDVQCWGGDTAPADLRAAGSAFHVLPG